MAPVEPTAEPETPSRKADIHAPFLARLRHAGANPTAFRHRGLVLWSALGLGALVVLILLPYVDARAAPFTQRLATLGALIFLFSAPALWMGLRRRAFFIATIVVLMLYGITGWTGAILQRGDLFVVAVLLGFAVFGLAGFNLVFVLEELVYDAHRFLPHRLRTRAWVAVPSLVTAALALGLPTLQQRTGAELPALWVAAIFCTFLLGAWWLFSIYKGFAVGPAILRELHLFVSGILLAAGLADSIPYLVGAEALIPGLVAYLALIGTWLYVSYTTLQRTHFLLRGRNAAPWVAILLAATYAIVAHAQAKAVETGETVAVQLLFEERMQYMVAGVALGTAFYIGRSAWRGLLILGRSDALSQRGRHVADQAAHVAEGFLVAERRVGEAALGFYRTLDEVLPGNRETGTSTAPEPPPSAWELEEGSHALRRVGDEDDGDGAGPGDR